MGRFFRLHSFVESLLQRCQQLWLAAAAIRLTAAGLLVFGPWTNEASELSGWDIERFVAIATAPGRAWSENPIEYPPGSVAVFEFLGAFGEIVAAHRTLVALMIAVDFLLAVALWRQSTTGSATSNGEKRWNAGKLYLVLGLPLVPMGLLRLDLLATGLAVAASLLLVTHDPSKNRSSRGSGFAIGGFGLLVAAGTLVKIWPLALIGAALGLNRWRFAASASLMTGTAIALWLAWVGDGIEPAQQILSLRGATGWHVESLGGTISTLKAEFGGADNLANDPRLELNAFRIGTLNSGVVLAGRALTIGVGLALVNRGRQRTLRRTRQGAAHSEALGIVGAIMLGSLAALVVTAPLLSPQFLLWLTPWAAITLIGPSKGHPATTPVLLTLAACAMTGAILGYFGPPNLADLIPATLLLVRNLILLAIPLSCWQWLGSADQTTVA